MSEIKDIKDMPGMKQDELKKCVLCKKGVMHDGCPIFYRMTMEGFIIDARGVQETSGLETFFGGGGHWAALANLMGANPDIAKQTFIRKKMFICQKCTLDFEIISLIDEDEDDEDDK